MLPLLENYKHCQNDQAKTDKVVPFETLFENNKGEQHKDDERNGFLNSFELNDIERSAIFFEANSVGRNLKQVFEKSEAPTDEYYRQKAEIFTPAHVFEFKMAIPSQCHKAIGNKQENNGSECFHCL